MKFHGFTLIEVMLAVFLSSILLLGMIDAYLSLHNTYQLQQKLARMQENGRFAIFYLNQAIRTAGDASCTDAILGYPNTELDAAWQYYLTHHVRANTDAFIISTCKSFGDKTQYAQTAYFIDKSGLYEKQAANERSQKLVEDITDMQINYGVRNTHKTLTYLPAGAISDWQSVSSVEISLLIQDKRWYTYVKLPHRN